MQNQKENLFSEKFKLLNSQEHAEDINWTSSDSSDFENVSNNCKISNSNKVGTRKRKRKKKVPKNISNLDITIVDVRRDHKEANSTHKSPDLPKESTQIKQEKSPVLARSPIFFPPYKSIKTEPSSPILTCKMREQQPKAKLLEKSPILPLKYISPKSSPTLRKKLFKVDGRDGNTNTEAVKERERKLDRRKSETSVTSNREFVHQTKCNSFNNNLNMKDLNKSLFNIPIKIEESQEDKSNNDNGIKSENNTNNMHIDIDIKIENTSNEYQIKLNDSDSFPSLKTTNIDLVNRVKSYFENHFGSETTSQHSISESLTPKNSSKTSDGYDITSIVTQLHSNRGSSQSEQDVSKNPSPISSQSAEMGFEKSKKPRYKKDGLAYRLNALLKKQNANISLWQHERFLAENSNFLIPKGEHLVFRIQKVCFKYGCYLVRAIDANECRYLIPINAIFVQDMVIAEDVILKLYEPYQIVDYNEDYKLITNACKFECIGLDD